VPIVTRVMVFYRAVELTQEFQHAIELRLFDDRMIFSKLLTTNLG